MSGGRPFAGLNGFLVDFTRVGDGGEGRSGSSSSSESERMCACMRGPPAAAKMFLTGWCGWAPPLRLGDRDRDAIDMGEGSPISTSMGVPTNIVWALPKGVRVPFLTAFVGSGDSIDNSVRSVVDGKSPSPEVLTEQNGISLWSRESLLEAGNEVRLASSWSTRACTSASKFFWSRSISSWTSRSISRRALSSHSLRTDASISCFICAWSEVTFLSFSSASHSL